MTRPLPDREPALRDAIARLAAIMARLRDPETGCPWDIEQTLPSLARYAIEEAHEVSDAITREAWDELPGELGDLLLQVVFQARIAQEAGLFDLTDVANAISDKLVARHPHVFGQESRAKSAAQQTRDWEAEKARERAARTQTGTLDGVALGLPALRLALHNLLVYGPGQFFKPHQDTEKHEGMVGTLVLVWPAPHIGGRLRLRHGRQRHDFDSQHLRAQSLRWLAFYADCQHEVRPVQEGWRVVLTFDLLLPQDEAQPRHRRHPVAQPIG